jgi:hypothetical protein
MTKAIVVALIAATPGVLGAVLGYFNARALRRQTKTESAVPIGRLLEQLDGKMDRLTDHVTNLRERVARLEGPLHEAGFPRKPDSWSREPSARATE